MRVRARLEFALTTSHAFHSLLVATIRSYKPLHHTVHLLTDVMRSPFSGGNWFMGIYLLLSYDLRDAYSTRDEHGKHLPSKSNTCTLSKHIRRQLLRYARHLLRDTTSEDHFEFANPRRHHGWNARLDRRTVYQYLERHPSRCVFSAVIRSTDDASYFAAVAVDFNFSPLSNDTSASIYMATCHKLGLLYR